MNQRRAGGAWPFPGLDVLGGILCGGLVLGGYGLQWFAGMEPCPFCLLERYLLIALAVAFALLAWARPRGWAHGAAGTLLLLPAGTGLAATIYHMRIQSGEVVSSCGEPTANPALNQGLSIAPQGPEPSWWEAWLPQSHSSCAQPDLFLGVNLVVWALAAFAALGGIGVLAHFGAMLRARLDSRRSGGFL
ncbi:MAG TPA: disulfide bond formation protein B [Gammaproteobacteria bacterium]|nr:disulfide bond formation protein B [Gammaproteobacteria bacterium]